MRRWCEYERALEAWPGNYASLTNWASALRERATQRKQKASALRAEGRNAEADELDREADADIRQAIEKIDRAIAMMPSYPHAHLVRALLCDGDLGNPACAVEEFEQVLRLAPDHPQRPLIDSELARLKAQLAARSSGALTAHPGSANTVSTTDSRPVYLLGITCNIHESSAALVKDGQLIAAAEEERFTRTKHDSRFPAAGDRLLSSRSGHFHARGVVRRLLLAAVERIAEAPLVAGPLFPRIAADLSGGQALARFGRHAVEPSRGAIQAVAHGISRHVLLRRPSPGACRQRIPRLAPPVRGDSDRRSVRRGLHDAALPTARGNRIRPLRRFYLPDSLGIFYAALTQFLGYRANADEYKVMGLASYGQPAIHRDVCRMVRFENGRLKNDNSWFAFHTRWRQLLLAPVRRGVRSAVPGRTPRRGGPLQGPRGQRPEADRGSHPADGGVVPERKPAKNTCAWREAWR